MEIVIATTNKHKLAEIKKILKKVKCVGKAVKVVEDGKTFEANALKKARAGAKKLGQLTIADDSGLVIEALAGRPGVRSARFARPATLKNLCGKVLRLMKNKKNRKAKFVCAIAVVSSTGDEKVVTGQCSGKIIFEMKGKNGFGYDPIFMPKSSRKTFGQMSSSSKNLVSHRRAALAKLKKINLEKMT